MATKTLLRSLALSALLAVVSVAHAATPGCDPTKMCCQEKDIGGNPGCKGGGNPIDIVTGNKYQREVDLAPLPGVLGLQIVRHYNSVYSRDSRRTDSRNGLVGRGWKLGYEIELTARGRHIQITRADGTPLHFTRGILDPRHYVAADPADGDIAPKDVAGTKGHVWRWLDGHEYSFDARGDLVQIAAPTGEFVSLRHDPANGQLLKVTDPQGRSLTLQYLDRESAQAGDRYRGVQAIDSPVGRFDYEYGAPKPQGANIEPTQLLANLVKVTYPAQDQTQRTSRLYHYEDARFPTLLTGITVQGTSSDGKPEPQRISTWAYDAEGRGILSVKGEPAKWQPGKDGKPSLIEGAGIEQVQLEHGQGQTIATNGLGQKTVFTWGPVKGQNQLLEVRGAGCAHCAGPNERYGYDKLGRLAETTRITPHGQPIQTTRSELDLQGRIKSVSRIEYRHGKAQPAQLLVRYGYDGTSPRPTLIARPSVIAGKEHLTRIAYNEAGQPTRITEEGFSPIDAQGQPSKDGSPIGRTTTYTYGSINARSLLTSIDGPLPNGPKNSPEDSDITRIEYDSRGDYVTAVVAPMNLRTSIQPDEQGRIAQVTGASGFTERYRYDARGDVLAITRLLRDQAIDGVSYRRDALGQVIEVLERINGKDVPRSRQAYDAAGRLLWQADALGLLRQAVYDLEGHLLKSIVVGAGMRQEERYTYDAQGRLQRVEDATGSARELVRDEAGRLIATIDPLGRETRYGREPHALRVVQAANTSKPLATRYELDEQGHLRAVTAEASDGMQTARSVTHTRLTDDFGREVAVSSPDSGKELRRFDVAGRLVHVRQSDGSVVDLEYDLAGHLVRRTVTPHGVPAEAAKPQTVRYVYERTRLAEIQDAEQGERYTYDDRGRVATKIVSLRLHDGTQASSTTRYRYDAQGLLVAQSLPDGSELQYERNGQLQIVSLHRQAGPWAPFGWGRTTLASGLQRDLIGLRQITYGNGITGQWQRSREGVLARVVYTSQLRDVSAIRTAFESLMSEAKAQSAASAPTPATPASAPGAFGLAHEPQALWDSRLLFDAAGNIVVHSQFANTAVARPGHTVLAYDALDQLAQAAQTPRPEIVTTSASQSANVWRYHHDSLGNRLLAQQGQPASDMAHTAKLAYAVDSDRTAEPMDPAGRPTQDAQRSYQWDGLGRLAGITKDGKTTAYRYNRLGLRVAKRGDTQQHYLYDDQRHRVAELDAQGRITREYVWMGAQLVAMVDFDQPQALRMPAEGVLQRLAQSLAVAWHGLTGDHARIAYVHANHLGAPIAVTDERGKPVWAAEYAPFGKRIGVGAITGIVKTAAPGHAPQAGVQGIRLDLRLPGQWEDEESALHYNDQRYYDPEAGRYVSPDPLGLRGGLNAYAYVGNNPLGYSDPLGLVLFAFDGTGNTDDLKWLRTHGSSLSNVRQFWSLYEDGNRRYVTGVGTTYRDAKYGDINPADYSRGTRLGIIPGVSLEDADMGGNYSGPVRIQRMIQYFNDEADLATDDNAAMEVDILGFSRGAAEARDFANRIAAHTDDGIYSYIGADGKQHCQKVDYRFMGLFDTVLSTNDTAHPYNLAIPKEFAYVAQAAALNEFRGDNHHAGYSSWGAFPLESISPGMYSTAPVPDQTRIERGFLGSHADIGGGFGANESQLAQVALTWMVDQAKAAGVKMGDSQLLHTVIADPVLHDKSDSIRAGAPGPYAEDRQVRYRDGSTTTMRKMPFSSGMSYTDTQQFINYFSTEDPRRMDLFQTGTVDMKGYLDWLDKNGYDIGLTVQ